MIERDNGNFTKTSPFLIRRKITVEEGSSVKSAKKIGNGLFVETENDAQTQTRRFLSMKQVGGVDVTVTPYGTINYVIVVRDRLNCVEQELVAEPASQVVIACKDLWTGRNGEV